MDGGSCLILRSNGIWAFGGQATACLVGGTFCPTYDMTMGGGGWGGGGEKVKWQNGFSVRSRVVDGLVVGR